MTPGDRIQTLLDERTATLARRRIEATQAKQTKSFLLCVVGSERFGIDLTNVASVLPGRACTPLPMSPPGLCGIIALSGHIVTVLDLAVALGLSSGVSDVEAGHLVRLRNQKPAVALAVERVLAIVEFDPSTLSGSGPEPHHLNSLGAAGISGYAPPGDGRGADGEDGFIVVDLPRVVGRFTS